jgi:hypothetical protein
LSVLAEEENNVGRFLKEAGKEDKTEAGGIMSSVGSTFSHSAQHRIAIRLPLVRLYQVCNPYPILYSLRVQENHCNIL